MWILFAVGSAFFAGATSVLAKAGIKSVSSDFATAFRTGVVLIFSGLSFAYNVAYAIAGGLTPVLLSLAIKDDPAAPIQYIVAMAALGVGLGVFVEWRDRPKTGVRVDFS